MDGAQLRRRGLVPAVGSMVDEGVLSAAERAYIRGDTENIAEAAEIDAAGKTSGGLDAAKIEAGKIKIAAIEANIYG